jgi:hypothetical protein
MRVLPRARRWGHLRMVQGQELGWVAGVSAPGLCRPRPRTSAWHQQHHCVWALPRHCVCLVGCVRGGKRAQTRTAQCTARCGVVLDEHSSLNPPPASHPPAPRCAQRGCPSWLRGCAGLCPARSPGSAREPEARHAQGGVVDESFVHGRDRVRAGALRARWCSPPPACISSMHPARRGVLGGQPHPPASVLQHHAGQAGRPAAP